VPNGLLRREDAMRVAHEQHERNAESMANEADR
jgi:hypothetical protein